MSNSDSASSSDASAASTALDGIKSATDQLKEAVNKVTTTVLGDPLLSQQQHDSDFIFSDLFAVTVRLSSAAGLPCAASADCFVRLTIGSELRTSRAVKCGSSPAWNETFSFVCKDRPDELKVEVVEKHRLQKDAVLGDATVPLADLLPASQQPQQPQHDSRSSSPAGAQSPAPSPDASATPSAPPAETPVQTPASPHNAAQPPSPTPAEAAQGPHAASGPSSAFTGATSPRSSSRTLTLSHTAGSASATVTLSIMATRINHVVGRSSQDELRGVSESDIDALTSLLDLTLVSASHLKRESLFSQDTTFAVVAFGLQSFRTHLVHRDNNPRYDEVCPIWIKRDTATFVLKISVYQDEGKHRHPALIGDAFLRITDLVPGKQYSLTIPLTREDPHTDKDLQALLEGMEFDVEKGGKGGEDVKGSTGSVHVQVCLRRREDVERDFYDQVMRVYDENGDGKLEEEEVLHLCQTVGTKVSDDELRTAMEETVKQTARPASSNSHSAQPAQQSAPSTSPPPAASDAAPEQESGAAAADHLHVTKEQLPALFRHRVFHNSDFLRSLHAVALHGPDALHSLMLKNFMFPAPPPSSGSVASPPESAGLSRSESSSENWDDADPVIDNDNTRILVFDRESGVTVREAIPAYIKAAMRLMYRSRGGRIIGHLQRTKRTLRSLTLAQGKKMDSAASAKGIPVFIATHRLNVTEIEKPVADYRTFNEFFARRLKPGVRSCEAEGDERVVVSPADCRLTVWDSIEQSRQVWVKGRNFTLANVLGAADSDGSLCAQLTGGSFLISRLAPQDYHRWHWPVSGKPGRRFPIDGDYNTVNPIAVRKNVDVYTDNKRVVCPVRTADFGLVVLVAVGATMVGSINFVKCRCGKEGGCSDGACVEGEPVRRFEEHGWFAFGGSTVLVLFQPGAVAFDEDLKRNSAAGLETLIKVGRRVGVATRGGKGEGEGGDKQAEQK